MLPIGNHCCNKKDHLLDKPFCLTFELTFSFHLVTEANPKMARPRGFEPHSVVCLRVDPLVLKGFP